jgi:hypothetical protein
MRQRYKEGFKNRLVIPEDALRMFNFLNENKKKNVLIYSCGPAFC